MSAPDITSAFGFTAFEHRPEPEYVFDELQDEQEVHARQNPMKAALKIMLDALRQDGGVPYLLDVDGVTPCDGITVTKAEIREFLQSNPGLEDLGPFGSIHKGEFQSLVECVAVAPLLMDRRFPFF